MATSQQARSALRGLRCGAIVLGLGFGCSGGSTGDDGVVLPLQPVQDLGPALGRFGTEGFRFGLGEQDSRRQEWLDEWLDAPYGAVFDCQVASTPTQGNASADPTRGRLTLYAREPEQSGDGAGRGIQVVVGGQGVTLDDAAGVLFDLDVTDSTIGELFTGTLALANGVVVVTASGTELRGAFGVPANDSLHWTTRLTPDGTASGLMELLEGGEDGMDAKGESRMEIASWSCVTVYPGSVAR